MGCSAHGRGHGRGVAHTPRGGCAGVHGYELQHRQRAEQVHVEPRGHDWRGPRCAHRRRTLFPLQRVQVAQRVSIPRGIFGTSCGQMGRVEAKQCARASRLLVRPIGPGVASLAQPQRRRRLLHRGHGHLRPPPTHALCLDLAIACFSTGDGALLGLPGGASRRSLAASEGLSAVHVSRPPSVSPWRLQLVPSCTLLGCICWTRHKCRVDLQIT
mmetsp:Transcript_6605/g.16439  ORF Transcript_6605/g.16439 Transcript_6605/m.16439 type:complete len:214 (+) Transcript_6605:769-1410(+)